MADESIERKTRGAFYGRRMGHPLRKGQAAILREALPALSLDIAKPAPSDLRSLFPHDVSDVRLEIGFGGGENLLHEAQENPGIGHIGCDVYLNGVAQFVAAVAAAKLANIRVHHGDAQPLLDWLPAASLARLDILYPDPWPKRRHWKRRFVQDATVAALARVLRPGGEFRFVSDIDSYVGWTLAHLVRAPDFVWTAERADDWRKPWPGYTMTRYGEKATREGRRAAYLIFRRR